MGARHSLNTAVGPTLTVLTHVFPQIGCSVLALPGCEVLHRTTADREPEPIRSRFIAVRCDSSVTRCRSLVPVVSMEFRWHARSFVLGRIHRLWLGKCVPSRPSRARTGHPGTPLLVDVDCQLVRFEGDRWIERAAAAHLNNVRSRCSHIKHLTDSHVIVDRCAGRNGHHLPI